MIIFFAVAGIPFYILIWWIIRKRQARSIKVKSIPSMLTLGCLVLFAVGLYYPSRGIGYAKYVYHHHQGEARTNLGAIFTTQVSYFANANTYGADFTVLNWAPAGGNIYTYYLPDMSLTNTKGTPDPVPYRPNEDWPFTIRPAASATGFTAIAIGNIDGDTFLDAWSVNDAKMITPLLDDTFNQDLVHFLPVPHPLTTFERFHMAVFKLDLAMVYYFQASTLLLVIMIIRDEVRWRRAKAYAQIGEERR